MATDGTLEHDPSRWNHRNGESCDQTRSQSGIREPKRTEAAPSVFADFNEPREGYDEPPVEAPDGAQIGAPLRDADTIDRIREEAWTNGYLMGRQGAPAEPAGSVLTAKLVSSLHELEVRTAEVVDTASLGVADLLVKAIVSVIEEDWAVSLPNRARALADRIRPALSVAPEYILRDGSGHEHHFADIAGLSGAIDDGIDGEDVTIRWHHGEATISRSALLEDLRHAILPLSAGLANTQNARHAS